MDGETATPIVGTGGEALLPDAQRQVFIDTLGDDGVSVTRNVYNPQTGKYEPVQINGAAATVKRVPRVSTETGMTAAQEAADADRDRGFVAAERHRRVAEAHGTQRNAQGWQRVWQGAERIRQATGGWRCLSTPRRASGSQKLLT